MPRSSGRSRAGPRSSIRPTARRWSPTSPTRCSVAAGRSTGSTGSSARTPARNAGSTGAARWSSTRSGRPRADVRHDRGHHGSAEGAGGAHRVRAPLRGDLRGHGRSDPHRRGGDAALPVGEFGRLRAARLHPRRAARADGPRHPSRRRTCRRSSISSRRSADGRSTVARSVPCLRKDGTVLLADIRASRPSWTGCLQHRLLHRRHRAPPSSRLQDRKLAQARRPDERGDPHHRPDGRDRVRQPRLRAVERASRPEPIDSAAMPSAFGEPRASGPARVRQTMRRTLSAGGSWSGDARPSAAVTGRSASRRPRSRRSATPTARSSGYVTVVRDVTDERALRSRARRDWPPRSSRRPTR